jgi:hypothetical protein
MQIAPGTIVVPISPVPTVTVAPTISTSGLQVKFFSFFGGGETVDAMMICRLIQGW